jgi:hypothetical protein
MATLRVFYEPGRELLTVFWQEPRETQLCTELDEGVVLIKDETTGEPIGLELLSYRPGDARFDSVNVEVGATR